MGTRCTFERHLKANALGIRTAFFKKILLKMTFPPEFGSNLKIVNSHWFCFILAMCDGGFSVRKCVNVEEIGRHTES